MVHTAALTAAAAAVFLSTPVAAAGIYTQGGPVVQVDAKSYDSLIARSNHTSILEFYAPWCGHCQNLKPAYEKAAKSLAGLAKVAAINCDDESNKAFCGSMGVQGFPTLKIVRPGKKTGRPNVEDYQGPRSAKGIVDAMVDKIPNHVKRVQDKDLDDWLAGSNDTTKAILFSNKGTTSALIKSLAVDFLGGISFAQIRDKEKSAVETFGISKYPTLVLLPGGDKESVVYDGDMKKEPMTAFLSQIMPPNPDPAPKKAKSSTKSDPKKKAESAKAKSSFDKASASHASQEASESPVGASSIVLEEEGPPTESPEPIASPDAPPPVKVADTPPVITSLEDQKTLQEHCLGEKTTTCILALLPKRTSSESDLPVGVSEALSSLSEVTHKHTLRKAKLFPFYAVPAENAGGDVLRASLSLKDGDEFELVAINGRRGWWRRFDGKDFGLEAVEGWIDAIRLGEGTKDKLPEGVIEVEKTNEGHSEL
ncbi:MAG: hypothetical protein M4579_007165 [Chaenotheca gracillima]|nr:MAG: hypothetical protein M4579_007165 [Chaenotheca gracillima]